MSPRKKTESVRAAVHIGPDFSEAERIVDFWDAILKAVNIDREPWWIRWLLKRAAIKAAKGLFAVNYASISGCTFSGLKTDTGIRVKTEPSR